jgi:hypothetical protein
MFDALKQAPEYKPYRRGAWQIAGGNAGPLNYTTSAAPASNSYSLANFTNT